MFFYIYIKIYMVVFWEKVLETKCKVILVVVEVVVWVWKYVITGLIYINEIL